MAQHLMRAAPIVACLTFLLASAVTVLPAAAQNFAPPSGAVLAQARKAPTPRLGGKPDLSGYWGVMQEFGSLKTVLDADGRLPVPTFGGGRRRGGGGGDGAPAYVPGAPEAIPPYKPELLAKVEHLDQNEADFDTAFNCKPWGSPRIGVPSEIFQRNGAIVLLYSNFARADFRVVPTDGRKHDATRDPSWYGDSVAHWEGDTLVIESVNFTDETWLGPGGWFHTVDMKLTERLIRVGNTLRWEAVVTDPQVLQRPWIIPPRTLTLGKANTHVIENPPCEERDKEHMVDKANDGRN